MISWLINVITLILLLLILFLAIYIAWSIQDYFNRKQLRWRKLRQLQGHRYNFYFMSERDLKKDTSAVNLASISYQGYTDATYESFYKNLSVDRFPIHVLVNWTKTIVEDLINAVSPINHVQSWCAYFDSAEYRDNARMTVHEDFVDFEDYELAYLWGAVYYWLRCYTEGFDNENLLAYIEKVACKKQFLRPYFYHYKNLAEGNSEMLGDDLSPCNPPLARTLTTEQTALLWLAIAMLTETEVTKKDLAPAVSKITGVGVASIRAKIVGAFKEKDKKVVASIFESSMPNLADKIMKM